MGAAWMMTTPDVGHAALAAFAGLTAAVALRASWWWPFAVILGILGERMHVRARPRNKHVP